nr:hypothetical protein [Tanacetum cinerariifolium]
VKLLASNDEAPDFIIKFLKMIQFRLNTPVRKIRTNNEYEFVNQTLRSYYESVGISHETSVAESLQQNGVVERRNRTLVEAAQTIKPDLSYIYVFGAFCYPNNDSEDLGKLQAKADIVPVVAAPRAVDLADSHVSTSIDQDAPSTNLTSQGSSSNVRPVHTLFESLNRWTKDHPMENVIDDPSRSVSTKKELHTNTMLCYFNAFLTLVELKSFIKLKKSDLAILSEESPSKKKFVKAKKVAATKPKPTKKKALDKADRGKGLNVLSEVALSEADQLKEATKRRKKDFHISQASGSGNGTDFESGVPDKQHRKTSGIDEGINTKLGFLDVPKYDSESEKESWGDSGEEEDDEVTKELYKDVNVNLGNKYIDIPYVDQ